MLSGKRIVLGVTGGIAAYKACDIVSRLKKQHADVRVVMTKNAEEFLSPLTFETLSGNPVYDDSFERAWEIGHISLAKWADLFVIAPATANIIGKMASGIADDLLSTTAMAMTVPVLIAPAMNTAMWKNAAVQGNLERLAARGVSFVGPESGILACGDEDIGRMSEPGSIVSRIQDMFTHRKDLDGCRILVTAGPTREMIDPVRFLSNRSTGKMGYALAEAARDRGAEVTLVSGPVALTPPAGVEFIPIGSTLELYDAVTSRAPGYDIVIQAAAPADFRPLATADQKIKKDGNKDGLDLHLVPNPDIARQLGQSKRLGQILVVFAAETHDVLENAQKKIVSKNADLMVANDVTQPGAGFAGDTNIVTLIDSKGRETLPLLSKRETADRILDRVLGLRRV